MDTQVQELPPKEEAIRLCFRFKPQDISGEPCARSIAVADAFIQLKYKRDFDWEKDYMYTPSGIDSVGDARRKLFMFLDINKHAHPTFQALLCYQITKGDPMYGFRLHSTYAG